MSKRDNFEKAFGVFMSYTGNLEVQNNEQRMRIASLMRGTAGLNTIINDQAAEIERLKASR